MWKLQSSYGEGVNRTMDPERMSMFCSFHQNNGKLSPPLSQIYDSKILTVFGGIPFQHVLDGACFCNGGKLRCSFYVRFQQKQHRGRLVPTLRCEAVRSVKTNKGRSAHRLDIVSLTQWSLRKMTDTLRSSEQQSPIKSLFHPVIQYFFFHRQVFCENRMFFCILVNRWCWKPLVRNNHVYNNTFITNICFLYTRMYTDHTVFNRFVQSIYFVCFNNNYYVLILLCFF